MSGKAESPEEPPQSMPMAIIGSGEKLEDCGDVWKVYACEEENPDSGTPAHEKILKFNHCMRRECPVCYNAWRTQRANKINDRIKKAFEPLSEKVAKKKFWYDSVGDLRHFWFSPPQKWAKERLKSVNSYRYMRTELNQNLREHGMRAGIVVFHPWRTTKYAEIMFADAKKEGKDGTDGGMWEWIKKAGLMDNEDFVYLSPHFHVIGYGFITDCDELCEKTAKRGRDGWRYGSIRALYGEDDVIKTVRYILGHTALMGESRAIESVTEDGYVYEKKQYPLNSITRFGELGRELKIEVVNRERVISECGNEECDNPLLEWENWEEVEEDGTKRISWISGDPEMAPRWINEMLWYYVERWKVYLKKYPDVFIYVDIGEPPYSKDKEG